MPSRDRLGGVATMLTANVVGDLIETSMAERGHAVASRPAQQIPLPQLTAVHRVGGSPFHPLEHARELSFNVETGQQVKVGRHNPQFEDPGTMSERNDRQLFPEPERTPVIDGGSPIPRGPDDMHEDAVMHLARCAAPIAARVPPRRATYRIPAQIPATPETTCRFSDTLLAAASAACSGTRPSRAIAAPRRFRVPPASSIPHTSDAK